MKVIARDSLPIVFDVMEDTDDDKSIFYPF
jgi:hypothetical protein